MHAHRSLSAQALVRALVLALVSALVVTLDLSSAARGQSVPTTTVSGSVYKANGAPASGSLQISWPAFTTAGGQAVAAGRTSATIGPDGKVTVALAPNIGAMPAGLFYTAVYHLSDGTTSTEYWVVPNTIEATIGQVRSTVLPAAQAVQAVNKAYVDQSIAQAVASQITPSGGTLTGPLYLAGDPTQAAQAANKHYVDTATAQLLPLAGGTLSGAMTAPRIGAVLQADQFAGADFGAQLQACVNALDGAYGGTCDARNFPGQVTMAANLTLAVANVTIYLPCSTIATAASIVIPAGTRNVSLHGCASRGTSAASGAQGGTVLLYSGSSALVQVGDASFASDTKGFRLDSVALNTTGAAAASAQAMAFYRTQEISLSSLYLLGNANQTALTLDGTGNYTGGTFEDMQFTGFQTAINGVGHTVSNTATTDWLNASTFVRMHIDCATQNGSPVAGTTGINLQAGDGNTFTGGDVEGCATALHLGAHAVNNTLVGVRNENSTAQVMADAGSSYNNWITGGTMYTGKLVDNGTRNSFLDTFHRSFNGLNGDWYGSQQDATVTNHFRLGIGTGSERGLLNRYQTDTGYRWTTGLSDATAGAQFYQVLDELNGVYRLSIGQYNPGQSSTNNQTVVNAAGSGAVVLNGSNNAGTGGVIFGSGGPASTTVATIDKTGSANFTGTLQVGGTAQSTGTMTVRNNADSEVDYYLWPGATSSQKGSFTYKDFDGSSQWFLVKDQANNWALNSAPGGLDSFKAYQSTNSGDTYINAAKSSGHIRLNYETGAGAETDIYSGSSSSLAAAFLGPTAIKLPGLAAGSGRSCLQIDSSGYLSNSGAGCGVAAAAGTAGISFADGSVQTSSQQGALNGQANDATARAAAATASSAAGTAEGDAQTGIANAAMAQAAANAAQMSANTALNGQANDATARAAAGTAEGDAQAGIANAATAETDAQMGITNAAAAQAAANDALNGQANDATARSAASSALAAAIAALPSNGVTTSPGGNANFPGTVSAGMTRSAITNGTINATVCSLGATAPTWCTTYKHGNGTDPGDWANAAFDAGRYSTAFAGSTKRCVVTFDSFLNPTVTLEVASTIFVPTGCHLRDYATNLDWTPSSGVFIHLGSSSTTHGQNLGTFVEGLHLGVMGGLQSAAPAENSVVVFALGADPGYNWHAFLDGVDQGPATVANAGENGSGITIRDNTIAGADVVFQGGTNYFTNEFANNQIFHNHHMIADTVCGTNSGERIALSHNMVWSQYGNAIVSNCGYEYRIDGSLDYSNEAGIPGDQNAAEVTGTNVNVDFGSGHLEHEGGPLLYTNNSGGATASSYIGFGGTSLRSFVPSGATATSTSCTVTGPYTVMGQSYNKATISASNAFVRNYRVSVAGFTGPCSGLNGNTYFVNRVSLSSSGFFVYVPTSVATGSSDTSAGVFTSSPDVAPIVLINTQPASSTGDYVKGRGTLNGSEPWLRLIDSTNDANSQGAVDFDSLLAAGGYQVPIAPHYSWYKGVPGTSSDSAYGGETLADCPSGKSCFVNVGGGPGGATTSTEAAGYLGKDQKFLNSGNPAFRIQPRSHGYLLGGLANNLWGSNVAWMFAPDGSFGIGSLCPTTYNSTTNDTLSQQCQLWIDSNGSVHTQAPMVATGTQSLSTSGCGTVTGAVGGKTAGSFVAGASSCTFTVTPGITAPNGFLCRAIDITSGTATLRQSASTTTTCQMFGTVTSGDTILWSVDRAF